MRAKLRRENNGRGSALGWNVASSSRMTSRRSIPAITALLVLVASSLAAPVVALADEDDKAFDPKDYAAELQGYVPGASALEGKLLAPCCWTQTIDIHGSEAALELRREIRRRLLAGESSDAIEASIVQRFGPRILAVPPGSPLKNVAAVMALGMAGAGGAAFMMLKRWRAQGGRDAKPNPKKGEAPSEGKQAELDARVDAELDELDNDP